VTTVLSPLYSVFLLWYTAKVNAIECFDTKLVAALQAKPVEAAAINTVIRFIVTDAGPEKGGSWTVSLKAPNPFCQTYAAEDAASVQATLTVSAINFIAWQGSIATGTQLWLDRKIMGPPQEILKMRQALALIPPSP
jgi:hypothetical protein